MTRDEKRAGKLHLTKTEFVVLCIGVALIVLGYAGVMFYGCATQVAKFAQVVR